MDEAILKIKKNAEQDDVLKVIEQAADELDETELETSHKWHERTTESTTVRALLKRQKDGRIKLPLCQRLYVWGAKMRALLLESINSNYSCGTIIVAESDKTQYLVDGLQRLTSCMYLSIDYDKIGMSAEEKKRVLDYSITLSIVKGMDENEIKDYFGRLNSGVALAAAVKERSKLPESLNHAVLSVASHNFFRKTETTATFNKGHHHELIAMNALLAVCGVEQGENKARPLCKALSEHESEVIAKTEQTKEVIDRVAEIYSELDSEIVKRSLNANFVGTLVYVLARGQHSNEQVRIVINQIFVGKRAIQDYTDTTRSGAGDAGKCRARYALIIKMLDKIKREEERDVT